MKEINGKTYPLWQQFLDQREDWIGGTITNEDMGETLTTEITDVILEANGPSAMFGFNGKDFNFVFGVKYGGISGDHKGKGIKFSTPYVGTCIAIKKADL